MPILVFAVVVLFAATGNLTPAERSLRSRLAAHRMHAAGKTNTKPARVAFDKRFEDEVDPDRVLEPDERARRAAHARSAYFAGLALKSAKARRAKRAAA